MDKIANLKLIVSNIHFENTKNWIMSYSILLYIIKTITFSCKKSDEEK